MGKHRLIAHPDHPPHGIEAVEVAIRAERGVWRLDYSVTGGVLALPALAQPARTDGLWKRTCFELFVKPAGGEGYFEFNFSPSSEWAAYAFDGYREGMRDFPLNTPAIEGALAVRVDLSGIPLAAWRIGVSAVIEEADGTRSFWALAHPAGRPDFHDAKGFALTIEDNSLVTPAEVPGPTHPRASS